MVDVPAADVRFRELQLARFHVSVLKQAKWQELSRAAGDTRGKRALDLGTDNGIISLLFRQQGGEWSSADLTAHAVRAIGRTLGESVTEIRDARLPFPDATFDLIVVADMLEHVENDHALLAEIARCLKVGGRAVLNVPRLKPLGLLHPLRRAIGLTDAWHGHLHAGYDARALRNLLPATLRLVGTREYVRFFSYALDTSLNAASGRASDASTMRTAKGTVSRKSGEEKPVSGAAKLMYPAMRAFVALDSLLPFTRGYMLVATLERTAGATVS
ncbi:MAG: class I SAM-dependent methyltransferase [Gemmatimonadaceae bacterium]|nr:class I SAM-dependent methyltransferase [Gemmatimonadaceae bacterium]